MITYQPRSTASITPNLITKREVLQESSKIYDPIGFLGPVTVRATILMQELWRQGIAWDEPLPPRPPNEVEGVGHRVGDDHVHSDSSTVLPIEQYLAK